MIVIILTYDDHVERGDENCAPPSGGGMGGVGLGEWPLFAAAFRADVLVVVITQLIETGSSSGPWSATTMLAGQRG